MLWDDFEQNKEILMKQYERPDWDIKSGLAPDKLRAECAVTAGEMAEAGSSRIRIKARMIELILLNAQIEVDPRDWFADRVNHGNIMYKLRNAWQKDIEGTCLKDILEMNRVAEESLAYTGDRDFSHTLPDWEAVLRLGLPGLLQRLKIARKDILSKNGVLTKEQEDFYDSSEKVYEAALSFVKRLAEKAAALSGEGGPGEKKNEKMRLVSGSLRNLSLHPPSDILEAMQLMFIQFFIQQNVEGEIIRSLGGLDRLLYRFYKTDTESGRYSVEQVRELLQYFMIRLNAKKFSANMPFYLCGTGADGKDATNELSYIILDVYDKLNVNDPKIHIRYHPGIPEKVLKIVLKSIRDGRNSFVFMNDTVVGAALTNIGISGSDAKNYTPVGCYEPSVTGKELPCTCNGVINTAKAVELVLFNGTDPLTGKSIGLKAGDGFTDFDGFYNAVREQISFFINRSIEKISAYEKYYMDINPSPFFSATIEECVRQGKDAYAGGAKYNNSSINAIGLASAVDSLVIIKKAVFEEKIVSHEILKKALSANWRGYEALRLKLAGSYPRYGNGDDEADSITLDLTRFISSSINNRPNARGGVYRCGFFSINWGIPYGRKTGATPDGRKAHEPLSKNLSPVTGGDKSGITALIDSITKIDYSGAPNGSVLDLMLHSSAVQGNDGLTAMLGIVKTYMKRGGMALQMNVFEPAALRRAQEHPDAYANLQVRLCGWNVYFVNLSREEQEEFIRLSEHSAGN